MKEESRKELLKLKSFYFIFFFFKSSATKFNQKNKRDEGYKYHILTDESDLICLCRAESSVLTRICFSFLNVFLLFVDLIDQFYSIFFSRC